MIKQFFILKHLNHFLQSLIGFISEHVSVYHHIPKSRMKKAFALSTIQQTQCWSLVYSSIMGMVAMHVIYLCNRTSCIVIPFLCVLRYSWDCGVSPSTEGAVDVQSESQQLFFEAIQ